MWQWGRRIDGLAAQPEGSFLRNKTPASNTCARKCLLLSLVGPKHPENECVSSVASDPATFWHVEKLLTSAYTEYTMFMWRNGNPEAHTSVIKDIGIV